MTTLPIINQSQRQANILPHDVQGSQQVIARGQNSSPANYYQWSADQVPFSGPPGRSEVQVYGPNPAREVIQDDAAMASLLPGKMANYPTLNLSGVYRSTSLEPIKLRGTSGALFGRTQSVVAGGRSRSRVGAIYRGTSLDPVQLRGGLGQLTKPEQVTTCQQSWDTGWINYQDAIVALLLLSIVERGDTVRVGDVFGDDVVGCLLILGLDAIEKSQEQWIKANPGATDAEKQARADAMQAQFESDNDWLISEGGQDCTGMGAGACVLGRAALLTGTAMRTGMSRADYQRLLGLAREMDAKGAWTPSDWTSNWNALVAEADKPWYENPWILGGGAAVVLAGVWFLTKK
jgi:hypothetical protein